MKNLLLRAFLVLLFVTSPLSMAAQGLIIEDAERFAALFLKYPDSLSAQVLQEEYLDKGTKGIQIFTYNRIENADKLAKSVSELRESYEKAVNIAVPAIRDMQAEANETLKSVRTLLKQDYDAPIFMVFGAGNSGGTASSRSVVIGLEVIAQFVKTEEEAKELMLYYAAHEVTHVYQARVRAKTGRILLGYALKEGFADFMANLVMGGMAESEVERHEYGLAHEKELWEEFQQEMNQNGWEPWMFGPGKDGRPADLGYWIGKRICEAYYEKATDKEQAIQELLKLEDLQLILEKSGYNPN